MYFKFKRRIFMTKYVISDLHGRKDKYDKVIEFLNSKDHLYILGDVIDRGPDGIEILLDIMKRENVTLLMGNHEKMMIDSFKNYKIFRLWTLRNGGSSTYNKFAELSKEVQDNVLNYLEKLPYAICDLKVGDRTFYLCHAHPLIEKNKGILYKEDITSYDEKIVLWERQQFSLTCRMEDRISIVGHTPTVFYQEKQPYEIVTCLSNDLKSGIIDIDCGLAAQNKFARLAVLCLDDLSVKYY